MKKGLILATTLAMALGVGVAVGAHQSKATEVKAETPTTSVKIAGSFTNWATNAVELIDTTPVDGKFVYTRDFAQNDEFKVVVNNGDWVSANWEGVSNSTDGGIIDGGDPDHNFKVATANKYTVKIATNIGDYGNKGYGVSVEKYVEPDVPTEGDGYYLVGSKTDFKFKNAPEMATAGIAEENVAELMNYFASKDEKIKVRGYFRNDAVPNKWSFYGGDATEFGEEDVEGNFVFSKDQAVDIFAKWVKVSEDPEEWQLQFFVTEHAERYDISIYDVLFEGKRLASTAVEPHVLRATQGVNFEYELPAMNGYYARGLYTDAACTVEYTPTKFNADATLYAKYTRLGEYMTGDATYSGSEALAWNVDGASYLSSVVLDPNNRLEGSVTIPASASKESPVKVKALRYIGDEVYYEKEVEKHTQWQGVTYDLGDTYSFVSLDKDSNLVFTKGGTYAVYINNENKVYLNEGAAAFYTKFLSDTGGVCRTDNKTDLVRLGEVWDDLKVVYNSLSASEKETIEAVGFNGGDEKGDDLHKMMARYAYIVTKYGSDAFENFIFPLVHVDPHPNMVYGGLNAMDAADNTTMIIVIAIAAISALAFTTLLVLKKRKQK